MTTKEQILSKWEYAWHNGYGLWGNQAGLNYQIISKHSRAEALKMLKADLEQYEGMGISSHIAEAINDLEGMDDSQDCSSCSTPLPETSPQNLCLDCSSPEWLKGNSKVIDEARMMAVGA